MTLGLLHFAIFCQIFEKTAKNTTERIFRTLPLGRTFPTVWSLFSSKSIDFNFLDPYKKCVGSRLIWLLWKKIWAICFLPYSKTFRQKTHVQKFCSKYYILAEKLEQKINCDRKIWNAQNIGQKISKNILKKKKIFRWKIICSKKFFNLFLNTVLIFFAKFKRNFP